jgi:hypothetical protein
LRRAGGRGKEVRRQAPAFLAPHEQAALESTLSVWHELALGYLRCFDEACGGNTGVFRVGPELAQQRNCAPAIPKAPPRPR